MELNTNVIYNENCVTGMQTHIPDGSVDLIIADPPYNLDKGKRAKYNFDHTKDKDGVSHKKEVDSNIIQSENRQWDSFTFDEYIDFSVSWLTEAKRILKPTGSMWIFGTYHNMGVINVILHQLEYNFINEVIWYKRNATPNLTRRNLTASHENLFWISKTKEYTFNYDWTREGSFPDDSFKNEGKQMRTVWDIHQSKAKDETKHGKHPTQKPLSILSRIIQISAKPGMVMLTPFAGSGSECVAAKSLGLSYIGFETRPEYVTLATLRLEDTACLSQ